MLGNISLIKAVMTDIELANGGALAALAALA
jgi:hypothetical protein